MICINCSGIETKVANSRTWRKDSKVWRRRTCEECGATFTTYETPDASKLVVVDTDKKPAKKVPFDLSYITISIYKALAASDEKEARHSALWLAKNVETRLAREKMISKAALAELVHEVLKGFNEIAAIQYAARHGMVVSLKRRGRPSVRRINRMTGDGS